MQSTAPGWDSQKVVGRDRNAYPLGEDHWQEGYVTVLPREEGIYE